MAVVDANEVASGTMVSLDLDLHAGEVPGKLTRDVLASGVAHFGNGDTCSLDVEIAKDYANAISLIAAAPIISSPSAAQGPFAAPVRSGDAGQTWNLVADGDIQPFGLQPYEISFIERSIGGTEVVRVGGQIFDPNKQNRVNFSVTHDPVETIILAVVAGFAALICGGVVLGETMLNAARDRAKIECGDRGVAKRTIKRKFGFAWVKGGAAVGCGVDYMIECNPAPAPPVLRSQAHRKRSHPHD